MAQLVERVLGKDEVGGSNPPSSTKRMSFDILFSFVNLGVQSSADLLHNFRDEVGVTLARSLCRLYNKNPLAFAKGFFHFTYFAYSTPRNSRITFTLIWPGYSNSASIFFAISFARKSACASSTCSGFTITRTSLPAWIA